MTDTTDIAALRHRSNNLRTADQTDTFIDLLLDKLEAERQRADDAHKYGSDRDSENESLMHTVGRLRVEIAELKAKLANPVVLPERKKAEFYVDGEFSNKDLAAIYNCTILELKKKIHAAGFTTVKGE